jgi:hypothetical protein
MGNPKGPQVLIPTPGQPHQRYGLGAVNEHTGATVVLCRRHTRRQDVAELLQALVDHQPTGPSDVAWDQASPHLDDAGEAVVRAAARRLVRLYLPTSSPWLKPSAMVWRRCCREVTPGDLFASMTAVREAAQEVFARYNQGPLRLRSIIGSHAA